MTAGESWLAVIGTAGRQSDASRINRALYDAMYVETLRAMSDWGVRSLVSGGAAVADHLAVRAFLEGRAERLALLLPAPFARSRGLYVRPRGGGDAETANRYHAQFSRACGLVSLRELAEAISHGAEVHVGAGFKARNLEVAARATHLLALTFGAPREAVDLTPDDPAFGDSRAAGLKDGGTAHTFREAWRCQVKRHVSLTLLERRLAAAAAPAPRWSRLASGPAMISRTERNRGPSR